MSSSFEKINNHLLNQVVSKLPVANRIRLSATSKTMHDALATVNRIGGPVNYYPETFPEVPEEHIASAKRRFSCMRRIFRNVATHFRDIRIPKNDYIRRIYNDETAYDIDISPYYKEVADAIKSDARSYGFKIQVDIKFSYRAIVMNITFPYTKKFPYTFALNFVNYVFRNTNEVHVALTCTDRDGGYLYFMIGNSWDNIEFNATSHRLKIQTPTVSFDYPVATKEKLIRMVTTAKMIRALKGNFRVDYERSNGTESKLRALKVFLARAGFAE
jgi:hypothetical protein